MDTAAGSGQRTRLSDFTLTTHMQSSAKSAPPAQQERALRAPNERLRSSVEQCDSNQRQIEIGNGGTKEFLVSKSVEHLFPCKQMFHTKWCTPMLKGQPPTFRNGKCSRCGVNERRRGGRYCLECHRMYSQDHRAAQKRNQARVCRMFALSSV